MVPAAEASATAIGDETLSRIRTLNGIPRLSGPPPVVTEICIAIHDNERREAVSEHYCRPNSSVWIAGCPKAQSSLSPGGPFVPLKVEARLP